MSACPHNIVILTQLHLKMCFKHENWGLVAARVWKMHTGLSALYEPSHELWQRKP